MVEWRLFAVPWGCLLFVIVLFPDYTHLLFSKKYVSTDGRTDARTRRKQYAPSTFSNVGGIKRSTKEIPPWNGH